VFLCFNLLCFQGILPTSPTNALHTSGSLNVFSFYVIKLSLNHRLNGSSSLVLTATSLSYVKAKNSTPHRIKTPDPIDIKFGVVDYVGKGTRHAYANPLKGGFSANG